MRGGVTYNTHNLCRCCEGWNWFFFPPSYNACKAPSLMLNSHNRCRNLHHHCVCCVGGYGHCLPRQPQLPGPIPHSSSYRNLPTAPRAPWLQPQPQLHTQPQPRPPLKFSTIDPLYRLAYGLVFFPGVLIILGSTRVWVWLRDVQGGV